MRESVFAQTIPVLLAGGACVRVAGFEAGVDAVEAVLPPEAGVGAGAGLLAGAVEAAGVAAGVAAAAEADSAEADFFERLFLGADGVELSAVASSSAAADFLVVLFFFEDAVPVSADACEDEASAEAVLAFFFFLVCFLVESVWL